MRRVWLLALVALMASAVILPAVYLLNQAKTDSASGNFFFGVSFGGTSVSQAKLLIDKVKGYTNLFVVNSWEINGAANETLLNEVCEYAINAGLNVMVYFNFVYYNYTEDLGNIYNASSWDLHGVSPWHIQWLNKAMEKWGNKFLGVYLYDEPGGTQIDLGHWDGTPMTGEPPTTFVNVTTYSQAATNYTASLRQSGSMQHITNSSIPNAVNSKVPVFTSDYALYWFDYLAGYDTVFVELGWNHSTTQHIALCRGAANMQGKDWGAIIVWTHREPPSYLASGAKILQDMTAAYRAGAKYVVVFNYPTYPEGNPYGILQEEHLAAMQQFWNYVHDHPRGTNGKVNGQVAFVLPKDYGWGMRNVADNMWGLWPADEKAPVIWENMNKLIQKYGLELDIVYDDDRFNIGEKYSTVYYWNSTIE